VTYRLLAVHAHPDDESSKGAATYAALLDKGAEVMIATCTGGEAGEVLNPRINATQHAERDLPGMRRQEMARARDVIGFQHRWLGFMDSGMASEDGVLPEACFAGIPVHVAARPLVRLVREFRPHVILTYDEIGGYPHPDHIHSHKIATYAFDEAGSRSFPELGEPWTPLKLYYERMFNLERAEKLRSRIDPETFDPSILEALDWQIERLRERRTRVTTRLAVGEYFSRRDDALRSHESQVAPDDRFFFSVPRDLEREVHPYEDYELAASRVPVTDELEHDLFAGIDLEASSLEAVLS